MPLSIDGSYNICVFAYNEERNIETSLHAIHSNIDARLNKCYLIANGCTDRTVEKAEQYRQEHNFEQLQIIELAIGDKCNAWNHYIHELAEAVGCHFMVDADVEFTEQSFPRLFTALQGAPDTVNTIAGMPQSGRNLEYYQSLVKDRSCFFGNLYGITPRFFNLIRSKQFFLPVGLNWIDSFLTKAANTDITFGQENLPQRVTFDADVGFQFESLSPFSWADIKLYKNRIARYELGKIQELFLDDIPVADWPRNMRPINEKISQDLDTLTQQLPLIKRILVKNRLQRLLKQ